MPTRVTLNRYSEAAGRAVDAAVADLNAFWARLAVTDADAVRDALLEFLPTLTASYGDVVAAAALEWYEDERAQVGGLAAYRPALPRESVPAAQAQRAVRSAAGFLYGDDRGACLRSLIGAVQRLVRTAGRDAVTKAAVEDPADTRFARVPRGARTCAFCSMLASRGFVYATREAAGQARVWHDHCDCEIVPAWDDRGTRVSGYDPDHLKDEYEDARAAVARDGGDPNDLRALTSMMRRTHPGSYTDGVTAAE